MLKIYGKVEDGTKAEIMGWVLSIREQKTLAFIIIVDNRKQVQLVVNDIKLLNHIRQNAVISASGTVKKTTQAPGGFEIHVNELRLISKVKKEPPFNIMAKELPSIDLRLDNRALDLRRPYNLDLFNIRATLIRSMREHLYSNGFLEVNTPKIIASASEGGAALFPLMYYDKQAFLAQSPQLYKEELTMPFEKVFEIGPIFRAEPSRTLKHLSESVSLDVEAAFFTNEDLMNLIEGLVKDLLSDIWESSPDLLMRIKAPKLNLPERFNRFTYGKIIDWLSENGRKINFGDDLGQKDLELFGSHINDFYFITEWPIKLKPFYIQPKDSEVTLSFDLMYRELELSSGGERVHDPSILRKNLKGAGLPLKSFRHHLIPYYYGMPPHGGFGMGVERFLMTVTGADNIREVSLYPRDVRRLTP
ncbi:MAG: aspartate--tRNA(Asn) ligase [Conexivisphaerales archaeon]